MISDIYYAPNFIQIENTLFESVLHSTEWDDEMKSRKTASFGVPYNSSNIKYLEKPIPKIFKSIIEKIAAIVNFEPNNILINYYTDGSSRMGFHSDDTSILKKNTGVVILSLGSDRIMRFKSKNNGEIFDLNLEKNSLLLMKNDNQNKYLHSILPSKHDNPRISVTFRRIEY